MKNVFALCLVLGGSLPLAAVTAAGSPPPAPPSSVLDIPPLTPAQQAQLRSGQIPDGLTDDQEEAVVLRYNLPWPTHRQRAITQQAMQLDRAAASALHAGRPGEAEADVRQALAISQGTDGLGDELLAAALEAQGKDQEALLAYKRMVDARDDATRVLLPYALLLLHAGRWEQAVAAYEKALPLLAFGDGVRANSHFRRDVPDPVGLETAIHIARGLTYNAEGDWAHESQDEEALSEYSKALQLAPDSDLANYYYGYGLQHLGRTAQARAAFQKTIRMAHGGVKLAAVRALKKLKAKPA